MRDTISDALVIARTIVRRRVRRRRRNRGRYLLWLAVFALLWLRVFVRYVDLGGGPPATTRVVPESVLATAERAGPEYLAVLTGVDPVDLGRVLVAGLWLVWVYVKSLGVTADTQDLSVGVGTLQASGVAAVVLAETLADNLRRLVRYGTHALLAGVLLALGDGSAAAVPVWLATLLALSVSASLTGYVLGLGVRWWLVSGPRRWRYRHAVGALAVGGGILPFMAVIHPDRTLALLPTAAAVAAWLPPAWFADALLTPVPGVSTSPPRAAAAFLGTVAVAPALYLVTTHLANRVWFSERGDATFYDPLFDRIAENDGAIDRLAALVVPVTARQTRALVRRSYLRQVRNPGRLYMLAAPVLLGGVTLVDGSPGDPTMPVFLAVLGPWAAGGAFALNPLSMEGPALPSLLTSTVSGRQVVHAATLGACVAAVPVTVLGVVLSGFGVARPPGVAVGATVLALVLVPTAAVLAVGVGTAMPTLAGRPGAERTYRSPDTYAILTYSLALLVVATPGAVALLTPVARWTPYDPVVVRAVGVATTVCLSAAAAVLSYRYAARRFGDLRL